MSLDNIILSLQCVKPVFRLVSPIAWVCLLVLKLSTDSDFQSKSIYVTHEHEDRKSTTFLVQANFSNLVLQCAFLGTTCNLFKNLIFKLGATVHVFIQVLCEAVRGRSPVSAHFRQFSNLVRSYLKIKTRNRAGIEITVKILLSVFSSSMKKLTCIYD